MLELALVLVLALALLPGLAAWHTTCRPCSRSAEWRAGWGR